MRCAGDQVPVVICIIRRQFMSDGAVEDIQGGAARVDACCPFFFVPQGGLELRPPSMFSQSQAPSTPWMRSSAESVARSCVCIYSPLF